MLKVQHASKEGFVVSEESAGNYQQVSTMTTKKRRIAMVDVVRSVLLLFDYVVL